MRPKFKSKNWTNLQINVVINYLEEKNLSTLEEIIIWSVLQNFPRITKSTLSNYLGPELYSMKKITNHPIQKKFY